MIVSWNWLKEYVRLDMPAETLVERLMMSGLNHESTSEVGGDIAIDLEVTSNRPDCLGHIGIARETAVVFGHELKLPPTDFIEFQTTIESLTSVVVEPDSAAWCPQYRARVIEGVKIGPSPEWMQRRLRSVGLNPINNVVDITNYVLLECGQPLHAFDWSKLHEKRIVVRHARAGERFLAINNKQYELDSKRGVIADADRAVALAGVMGGADTEVSPNTTTILLESAEFAPLSIRRTSRALDLSSDSSYRFERKIDPVGVAWASDRACHLLCKLAGGKVARGFIHIGVNNYAREPIRLRWPRVDRILGVSCSRERTVADLEKIGCRVAPAETLARNEASSEATSSLPSATTSASSPRGGGSGWGGGNAALSATESLVTPPSFRRDLTREIDLIEEIGRIAGYHLAPEDRVIPMAVATVDRPDRVSALVRDTFCATGYFEAVTFSFSSQASVGSVRPWSSAEPLTVRHSSRKQENCLRQSLLPSLLTSLRINEARGNENVSLFEIARIYLPSTGMPNEQSAVGLVSQRDIREVRGHVELLFERLGLTPKFAPSAIPGFASDRAGEYLLDGKRIGVLGYVDDSVREPLDLRSPAVAAELLLQPLVDDARLIARTTPLPDQPAMIRDLAIVLDEPVRWSDLEEVVRNSAGPALERLEFVDLYRGKQVPDGKKSIAFRLTYRASDRTLTREEVDGFQQRVIATVAERLAGVLRQ